jgi:hypothetical protein
MSKTIIAQMFVILILTLALSLFIAFVTGHIDLERIPETDLIEGTFSYHGECPDDSDWIEDLFDRLSNDKPENGES